MANMDEQNPPTNQDPQAPKLSLNDVRPQEIYERMAAYVSETDGLIALLHNTLSKAEAQLTEISAYDSRVKQLGSDFTPIDTATIQAEIEEVRKHIMALEVFRDRTKTDMENVKKISERISNIMGRYQNIK